ncbi:MAG: SIMPL domain-containing protein [Pseudomonadota bacterium]
MFPLPLRQAGAALAVTALAVPVACAQTAAVTGASPVSTHPNSIQPETTLSVQADSTVMAEPDLAIINAGVETEAKTAQAAMADNRAAMNAVFDVLRQAGIADRDMQTSNFQIFPRYDYVKVRSSNSTSRDRRELQGYTVTNQLTVRVRELDNLGPTLDALVEAGGNTFNGLSFGLDDDTAVLNSAREQAVKAAVERAELLASAAGYRVGRIVTMSENSYNRGPQPMMAMARAESADMSTPIASGEVGYTANVSITFELVR